MGCVTWMEKQNSDRETSREDNFGEICVDGCDGNRT
jgi:hypothetical protein